MAQRPRGARAQRGELASAIQAKGYNWMAGETSVSGLSEAEQKSRLGLDVSEDELKATAQLIRAAAALQAVQQPLAAAPASMDWRNNGGDWTTPIKDQKSCGSCVAFGTAATIEARVKIACKSVSMTPDLAEAHLFYCGCGSCCATGWNFAPALDFAVKTGVAKESDFPYTPGNQPCQQGLTPYVKLTAWTTVLTVADRKNIIASKGPVVGGMAVFSDFFAYQNGVYRHVTGQLSGYHAISVVGYDDAQQCWICKNSWGTGWGESGPSGERGWFRIGYGECSMDTSFAFYDVDLSCPVPPGDPCKKYLASLVKILQAARANAALRACLRFYVCGVGRRPLCLPAHSKVVAMTLAILKRCPQYLKPFCRAV